MNIRSRLAVTGLSALALLILSGCSTEAVEMKNDSDEVVLNVPDSNPYKVEITRYFNETKSSFARKVLADGVVTEAELAESESQYMTCLEDIGMKVTVTKTQGTPTGFEMEPIEGSNLKQEELEKGTAECNSLGFGEIVGVHGMATSNPDRKNPVQMMLKCLKKRGVVEEGVALKEFDPMYEDWDYMDAHRADFDACYADPNFYNQ